MKRRKLHNNKTKLKNTVIMNRKKDIKALLYIKKKKNRTG